MKQGREIPEELVWVWQLQKYYCFCMEERFAVESQERKTTFYDYFCRMQKFNYEENFNEILYQILGN